VLQTKKSNPCEGLIYGLSQLEKTMVLTAWTTNVEGMNSGNRKVVLPLARTKRRMKRESSKVSGPVAQKAAVATKREREAAAPPPPPELLVLESCFLDGVECSELLQAVPIALLLEWEAVSTILKEGLAGAQWWERYFAQLHPVTYARIAVDTSRATALLHCRHGVIDQSGGAETDLDLWRELMLFEQQSELRHRIVWREQFTGGINVGARIVQSIHVADEFGVDSSHQLIFSSLQIQQEKPPLAVLRAFTLGPSDSVTLSYFDFNNQQQPGNWPQHLVPLRSWTVPFRNAALVLFQHSVSGHQELVWVKTKPKQESKANQLQQDLRYWVLNRNVMLDNEDDFVIPSWSSSSLFDPDASIDGLIQSDVEIHHDPILVAATCDGCLAVVIGGDVVLTFDEQLEKKTMTKEKNTAKEENWRDLLTAEFVVDRRMEPRAGGGVRLTVTAACYVLDSFLLLATTDGVLRGHPRNNPKSEYFVENLGSLVSQLVSLCNVVAVIHSYCILEVRSVTRSAEDPFMRFDVLYQMRGVDCDHPPLLCGPYVIFAGLDGCWYRVLYDMSSTVGVNGDVKPFPIKAKDETIEAKCDDSKKLSAMERMQKEEIRIPYHAGWQIVSIKNANWRYWTLVVQEPITRAMSELLLFANGTIDS
jgi:hypothetical protein